jgi:hypothetical protein
MHLQTRRLKNAERILRLFLVSLLVMTAFYKLAIGSDHFIEWYKARFLLNPYGLSMELINPFMHSIAYIELLLAIGLLFERSRNVALIGYFSFLSLLMFGHFCLSEFHEVNGLFDYVFAGLIIYVLPRHQTLLARDK